MFIFVRFVFKSGTVSTSQYDTWGDLLKDLRDNRKRISHVDITVVPG